MKPSRRVRSLLLNKQLGVSNVLAVILCILGGILCGGAILLLLIKVPTFAEEGEVQPQILQYDSLDDNVEVVNRLSFSFSGEDSKTIVTQMYQDGRNLYVVPAPLIVNSSNISLGKNRVGSGVWGNILGGISNQINSDNITIIGGEGNVVSGGNINSTVLGGSGNILGQGKGTPSIVLGGKNNRLEGNEGVILMMGGSENNINNTKNVNIVGGSNNTLSGGSNVIVGGLNVRVRSGVENVFIFSDGDRIFSPKNTDEGSNTFYLQVEKGLGLNIGSSKGGVESKGAVSFGKIDIENEGCTDANLGVEGMWEVEYSTPTSTSTYGCFVGCTTTSRNAGGAWEMLDKGEQCIKICELSGKCISSEDIEDEEEDYESFCSTGMISTGNSYMCNVGQLLKYKNVVFETALIDSDTNCPDGEDKCIYRCNSGYHLTGDVTGKPNPINKVACYSNCKLPWKDAHGNDIYIRHNETVIGYDNTEAKCSIPNLNFASDANTTHDDCGKHKATLVCSDGELYVANSANKVSNPEKTASEAGYKYESCDLKQYRCDLTNFNLTQIEITGSLHDQVSWTNSWLKSRDGRRVGGVKGIYKLCIDYDPHSNPNGEQCDEVDPFHFRLVGCQNGYSTGAHHPGECRKKVKLIYDYRTNGGTSMNMSNEKYPVTSGYLVDLTTPKATKQIAGVGEWTFLGWNTDPDAHVGLTGEVRVPSDNDFRLYAIFTKEITATFHDNGDEITLKRKIGANLVTQSPIMTGSCVMWNKDTSCTFTGTYTFTREDGGGWMVDGWSTNKNATSATHGTGNVPYIISKDTNFYTISHKRWNATFNKNGAEKVGGSTNSLIIPCNIYNKQTTCNVTAPSIERKCWSLKGWNTNQNATTGVAAGSSIALSGDMAYYAITLKKLKASFDANTGVAMNKLGLSSESRVSQSCEIKNTGTKCKVKLPTISTNNLYSAKGWTLYSGPWTDNVMVPGDEYTLVDDGSCSYELKFYAQVTNECGGKYKVAFAYTGNGGESIEGSDVINDLLPGSSINLVGSSAPVVNRSGWIFEGWNEDKTKHLGQSKVVIDYCGDKVVYPIFSRDCTVSFDANGAIELSYPSSTCTIWNTDTSCKRTAPAIQGSTNTPIPKGFSTGKNVHASVWSGNEIKNVYLDSGETIHCGGTYYAQTTKDPVSYTITFNPNGNKITNNGIQYTATSSSVLCTILASWNGAQQSSSCTEQITFPEIEPAEGKTEIGWTTSASNHDATSAIKSGKKVRLTASSDLSYFAQSEGKLKRTVYFDDNDNYNCEVENKIQTCTTSTTLYNNQTDGEGSCNVTAPDFTVPDNFDKIGYNTKKSDVEEKYKVGDSVSVSKNGEKYYCIAEEIFRSCTTPKGNTIEHGGTYESYAKNSGCYECERIVVECDNGVWKGDNEPTSIDNCTSDVCPGECEQEHYKCKNGGESINNKEDITNNKWTWDCKGSNGGATVSCSQNKVLPIPGECGEKPYECKNGGKSINNNEDTTDKKWTWECKGKNGGATASCSQNFPKNDCACNGVIVPNGGEYKLYNCVNGLSSVNLVCKKGTLREQVYGNLYVFKSCAGWTTTQPDCGGGGGGGGGEGVPYQGDGCFPEGTKVIMADGSQKNIEDVQEGEMVLSYNVDKDMNEPSEVEQMIVHEDDMHEMYELTVNGRILRVTDVHPFYVRKSSLGGYNLFGMNNVHKFEPKYLIFSQNYEWVEAQNLKVGDRLLTIDGNLVEVEKIYHYYNQETVYNLEVEGNHDYYVDWGYLVHNKGGNNDDDDDDDGEEKRCGTWSRGSAGLTGDLTWDLRSLYHGGSGGLTGSNAPLAGWVGTSDFCIGGFTCKYDKDRDICKDGMTEGEPSNWHLGDLCCCVVGTSTGGALCH